ncbi:MAG: YmdB family metallophosphoesterase, partial [Patescibacteria group bacterium]
VYNPFLKADEILASYAGEKFDAVLVDFHRETTAEIYCMAEYLSGRATFVYGTHTHVQTNDEHILESGTGMIADVGMTGPLHSAIGQAFEGRLPGMVTGISMFSKKPEPLADGPGSLHAVLVEIEGGKCVSVEKIRIRD